MWRRSKRFHHLYQIHFVCGHCIVYPSSIYDFIWHLQTFLKTSVNKLKNVSEVVWLTFLNKLKITLDALSLLLITDQLQQIADRVIDCTTWTHYWSLQHLKDCKWCHYIYQLWTSFNKLWIMSEVIFYEIKTVLN